MATFSVTERGVFKRCQRRAVLTSKNGENLGELLPSLALSAGTITHRAHQLWIEAPERSLQECALAASSEAVNSAKRRYQAVVGAPPNDDELAKIHDAVDVVLQMCENYAIKYGTPLPDDYRLIKAEQKILAPVPGTEHQCERCELEGLPRGQVMRRIGPGTTEVIVCPDCNGTLVAPHFLEGRLDSIIQHIPTGRIDVLERKTYGSRPKIESLQTNDQFLAYGWLVKQLGFNAHLEPAVAYDGMWRRAEVPRGRTFDDLFLRLTLTRSPAEYAEFSRLLPLELNAMAALYAKPADATINRRWEGCYDCPFDDRAGRTGLCRAMSRGEADLADQIKRTHFTQRDDNVEEADTE